MITLYTIDCPKCKILEAKLNAKHIEYVTVKDKDEMVRTGISKHPFPVLVVNDQLMEYGEAVRWVNSKESDAN